MQRPQNTESLYKTSDYEFKIYIPEKDYYKFLRKCPSVSFMQDPVWARVKDNWESCICALYHNDEICAGALLLLRPLPLGKSFIYSPRGLIVDYGNLAALNAFTEGLRRFAKTKNAIFATIDPYLVVNKDNGPSHIVLEDGSQEALSFLPSAGWKHKGFTSDMHDSMQPRYNAMIPLFDNEEELYKHFPKSLRRYMGNGSYKKGLSFTHTPATEADLHEFKRLLECTEQRQNIALRTEDYFRKIAEAFGDRAIITFATLDIEKYIDYLNNQLASGNNVEQCKEKILEANAVMKDRGQHVNLATGLVLLPREDEKFKVAEYIYGGSDLSHFHTLHAPAGLIYESCVYALKQGCNYWNIGGMSGDMTEPLSEFKLRFNPCILEYVGDFELVISKPLYFAYTSLLPQVRKISHAIAKKKH